MMKECTTNMNKQIPKFHPTIFFFTTYPALRVVGGLGPIPAMHVSTDRLQFIFRRVAAQHHCTKCRHCTAVTDAGTGATYNCRQARQVCWAAVQEIKLKLTSECWCFGPGLTFMDWHQSNAKGIEVRAHQMPVLKCCIEHFDDYFFFFFNCIFLKISGCLHSSHSFFNTFIGLDYPTHLKYVVPTVQFIYFRFAFMSQPNVVDWNVRVVATSEVRSLFWLVPVSEFSKTFNVWKDTDKPNIIWPIKLIGKVERNKACFFNKIPQFMLIKSQVTMWGNAGVTVHHRLCKALCHILFSPWTLPPQQYQLLQTHHRHFWGDGKTKTKKSSCHIRLAVWFLLAKSCIRLCNECVNVQSCSPELWTPLGS